MSILLLKWRLLQTHIHFILVRRSLSILPVELRNLTSAIRKNSQSKNYLEVSGIRLPETFLF